jgi:putative tryptophan/tyrosine transport system substrate-binding protein
MRRRDFLAIIGGVASTWSLAAEAQQPEMPVVGFLSSGSSKDRQDQVEQFLKGLKEAGRKVGDNTAIEYSWANDQDDQFQPLAVEMVERKPAVIAVSSGTALALAVKAATTTIPVVFCVGGDPVKNGLVLSLNRPGGNVTGVSYLSNALAPKRLELLRELAPKTAVVAHLVNPKNANAKADTDEMLAAARTIGAEIALLKASNISEIEAAFSSIAQRKIAALVVASDTVFLGQRAYVVALSGQYKVAAVFDGREYTVAGGLISYGANRPAAFRPAGVCVGRILNGAVPAEIPVEQPTALELVVNQKTAKNLGISIPPTLLARADEVIE